MKTKILTIAIAAILFVLPVSAQDIFPLSGAKWTGLITRDEGSTYTYFSYVMQGDTIVDDILRSKLYYIPDINKAKPDTLLVGYFHIVEKVVFYRIHEIEKGVYAVGLYPICSEYESDYPLYDFSLQEGDIYSYFCDSYDFELWQLVTSVQQVEFGGSNRKKIIFNGYNSLFWLEGMGSNRGFFCWKETGIPKSESVFHDYICFSVNDEVLYINPFYSKCPVPQFNAIPEVKTNSLSIFPNPMKSTATIQSDQPLQSIQIYDISGVLLYQQTCNGELQVTINKQSLLQGTYFIKVTLQTGETQIEKLIVQ